MPLLLALVCLAALVAPGPATAMPHLSPTLTGRLDKWDVLSFSTTGAKDGDVKRGKAIGRIASSPEAVLHALLDVGKYQHWLPQMKGSREVRRRGKQVWAVLETHLPWPVRDAWVYVKMNYTAKPGRVYEARWEMINGTLKQYAGYALIEPWSKDAFHSVITFSIITEPKTAAPDAAISKGTRKVAEIFVHRLRMRVAALRKFGKLPSSLLLQYRH